MHWSHNIKFVSINIQLNSESVSSQTTLSGEFITIKYKQGFFFTVPICSVEFLVKNAGICANKNIYYTLLIMWYASVFCVKYFSSLTKQQGFLHGSQTE